MNKIRDIEEKRIEILQHIAEGGSLKETLKMLCLHTQSYSQGLRCSVLLYDQEKNYLTNGAAPNLPDFYNEAVEKLEAGPEVGSCGTAAYLGKRVIIEDAQTHRFWAPYFSLVKRAGFRACWSQPVFSKAHKVIGTFAMYHDEIKSPSDAEIALIEAQAQIASIAISHSARDTELIEANDRLTSLLNSQSELISRFTPKGIFTFSNHSSHETAYKGFNNIVGQSLYDFVPLDEQEHVRNCVASLSIENPQLVFENNILNMDGSKRLFEWHLRAHFNADDKIYEIQSSGRDVTERRVTEKQLKDTVRLYRQAVQLSGVGHWVWNELTEKLQYCSKEAAKVYGTSVEDALNTNGTLIGNLKTIHPDDQVNYHKTIKDAEINKTGYEIIVRCFTPAGDIQYIHEIADAVLDDNGLLIQTIGTVQNVTDRYVAEKKQEETLRLFRQAVRMTGVGHWVWDEVNNKLDYCSEQAAIIYGSSVENRDNSENANIILNPSTLHPEDRENFIKLIEDAVTNKTGYETVIRIYTDDGELRYIHETAEAILDEDGKLLQTIGTIQDITDQKRAEADLIQARLESDMANKAKSDFLANMSHELRTPLNAIIGFSGILKGDVLDRLSVEKCKDYANDIYESGEYLLNVINDILDTAKIEANKVTLQDDRLSLCDTVISCYNMVQVQADKHDITLETEIDTDLPLLRADNTRLIQMIANLVSNAVKFTPDGGKVTASAVITPQNEIKISIADTGIGIAESDIDHVLTKFGQVNSSYIRNHQGTGLGLSLVKLLIEAHDGNFAIKSASGEGTIVTLTFPPGRTIAS